MKRLLAAAGLLAALSILPGSAHAYDPQEKSIAALAADLAAGRISAVDLVNLYEARIADLNPRLHAIISVNPEAQAEAAASDARRRAGAPLGALDGAPILLKDNIESADPLATTAGSLALKSNLTRRDAPLVARLRAAGAVILGKTNLSEWANIRSSHSISGWSAVGGQTRNPYALDRDACGSSSGSAAAAAASLAAAAIGTETDGSVTCPASLNGLVGLKPTVGLVSRTHIVPISHSQDTAGPMARSVADAALLLSVMAGTDPEDVRTLGADQHRSDYLQGLRPDALAGVRIGVMRFAAGFQPETDRVFEAALESLRQAGATLVEIPVSPFSRRLNRLEQKVLHTELKADLTTYLQTTAPNAVPSRTLTDLIAFNRAHSGEEMPLFGQEIFLEADQTAGLADPAYLAAERDAAELAGPQGIDKALTAAGVSVLVAPTLGPAWLIDPVNKDQSVGGGAGQAAAVAGYPHLTVPMGQVDGLPVGLSFVGPAWSEARLLAYGYAFEQKAAARRPPTYRPSAEAVSEADWQAQAPAPPPKIEADPETD